MRIEYIKENGVTIAVVTGEEKVVTDAASALELAMSAKYETGADRLAIDKRVIAEDFFILSTGMAGEILQKFINYHVKAAIWGDYTRYAGKPLKDFIYESNQGSQVGFWPDQDSALAWLGK